MLSEEENNKRWEAYFIDGTNVLKNNLGISNREELQEKEIEISFNKLLELHLKPIEMNFDAEHLKAIHHYLFSDIYPFAGEYRNVYMQKNHSYFAPVDQIEPRLKNTFDLMEEELTRVRSPYDFACFLATFFVELLHIHPFREGNGRSIREFIREYANEKSKNLPFGQQNFSWSKIDKDAINEFIEFSMAFRSRIEIEFLKALEPVQKELDKTII